MVVTTCIVVVEISDAQQAQLTDLPLGTDDFFIEAGTHKEFQSWSSNAFNAPSISARHTLNGLPESALAPKNRCQVRTG